MDQNEIKPILKIVTWLWIDQGLHPKKGIAFSFDHVNKLYYGLVKHLHAPFEMICITDIPDGIDSNVQILNPNEFSPAWQSFDELPGCFRRLVLFSPEAETVIGSRFACIDLDLVIVDDVTDIFCRNEDFLIWGEHHRKSPYCGSFFIMDAGCRVQVWNSFNFDNYNPNHRGRWPYGTDQDHICHCLYPNEVMLTTKDGVHSFNFSARRWHRSHIKKDSKYKTGKYLKDFFAQGGMKKSLKQPLFDGDGTLPSGAKIIFFNGKFDPSHEHIQKEYPWVVEHWVNLI